MKQPNSMAPQLTRAQFNERLSAVVAANKGRSIYVSKAPDKIKSVLVHEPGEHWKQLNQTTKKGGE